MAQVFFCGNERSGKGPRNPSALHYAFGAVASGGVVQVLNSHVAADGSKMIVTQHYPTIPSSFIEKPCSVKA